MDVLELPNLNLLQSGFIEFDRDGFHRIGFLRIWDEDEFKPGSEKISGRIWDESGLVQDEFATYSGQYREEL